MIKKIKIKIPTTEEGKFDLKKQQEITEKYQHIKELRNIVKADEQEVDELVVDIEKNLEVKKEEVAIGEIFDLSRSETNSGKLTKSFVDKNRGNIPVYGASKEENNANYGRVRDNLPDIKYFENCLT